MSGDNQTRLGHDLNPVGIQPRHEIMLDFFICARTSKNQASPDNKYRNNCRKFKFSPLGYRVLALYPTKIFPAVGKKEEMISTI